MKKYPHLLGHQWMLQPSCGDHESNPKLVHIDGFDAFSLHLHEYNLYAHDKKIEWSRPEIIRALASNPSLLLITDHCSQ